jgi:hypothetical protein
MLKTKLTLSIDKDVLEAAKRSADQKHIPLSRLVENFLAFFASPYVYCFKCGEKFNVTEAKVCAKCGWLICPECKVCGCGLKEETAIGIFHMRKVYEDLLAGRVK